MADAEWSVLNTRRGAQTSDGEKVSLQYIMQRENNQYYINRFDSDNYGASIRPVEPVEPRLGFAH